MRQTQYKLTLILNLVKEGRIMSNSLNELISEFCEAAAKPVLDQSYKWKAGLREVLNTKVQRADSQQSYLNALESNILFFNNTWNEVKGIVERWLRTRNIPSSSAFQAEVASMRERNLMSHNNTGIFYKNGRALTLNDTNLIKKYNAIIPVTTRIENLEWDYIYAYTRSELMYNLLGIIVEYKQYSTQFYQVSPSELCGVLFKNLEFHTNVCIGNVKFDLNKK
jgi:hypothetical protein